MGMIAHPGNCFANSEPYVYQDLQISRRRRPGKTEAIEYWLWLKMNGFMSTLLDPQEYCLQGMSYTFSQLIPLGQPKVAILLLLVLTLHWNLPEPARAEPARAESAKQKFLVVWGTCQISRMIIVATSECPSGASNSSEGQLCYELYSYYSTMAAVTWLRCTKQIVR